MKVISVTKIANFDREEFPIELLNFLESGKIPSLMEYSDQGVDNLGEHIWNAHDLMEKAFVQPSTLIQKQSKMIHDMVIDEDTYLFRVITHHL
jgi:hypothetical protein